MSTVWELLKRLGVGTWRGIVMVGTLIFVVLPMIGFFVMPLLRGCSDTTLTWQEEVKLLDGRVITVTQKRRFEEDFPREAWLTLKLSEFGDQLLVWHENLRPLVLNIHEGKLYLVATPFSYREFVQYGSPKPLYVQFSYEDKRWLRIPFNTIPVAIYDINMLKANAPAEGVQRVTIEDKKIEMQDYRLSASDKKINPEWTY